MSAQREQFTRRFRPNLDNEAAEPRFWAIPLPRARFKGRIREENVLTDPCLRRRLTLRRDESRRREAIWAIPGEEEALPMFVECRREVFVPFLLVLVTVAAGCGTVRETFPGRSATEQLLISTAADRAIEEFPPSGLKGKSIFVETANLDVADEPYVVGRLQRYILENGGKLAGDRSSADVVLGVASGGLSVDHTGFLIGIPSLPLSVAGGVVTPEIALFRLSTHTGRAKFLFSPVDPDDASQLYRVPLCRGESTAKYYWVLALGPFRRTDLDEGPD